MPAALDLPDLERILGQVVIDALVGASLVMEAHPRLYHGSQPPADCCPKEGEAARLYVWWEPLGATDGCGGPMPVSIYLRQYSCWPVPSNPVHADPGPADEHAAYLARCAWVGTAGLNDLICDKAAKRAMGISRVLMLPTKPVRPRGGCAGNDWALRVWPMAAGWRDGGGGS